LIRLSRTLNRILGRHRDGSLIRRVARPAVLGIVALVAIVAVGVAACGGGSSSSGSGSSSGTSTSQTSFKTCLEQHGVTAPQGGGTGGGGGSGTPQARPTGSAGSSFKTAMQACRGSSGGPGSAG
jgi:hypothetical protein